MSFTCFRLPIRPGQTINSNPIDCVCFSRSPRQIARQCPLVVPIRQPSKSYIAITGTVQENTLSNTSTISNRNQLQRSSLAACYRSIPGIELYSMEWWIIYFISTRNRANRCPPVQTTQSARLYYFSCQLSRPTSGKQQVPGLEPDRCGSCPRVPFRYRTDDEEEQRAAALLESQTAVAAGEP